MERSRVKGMTESVKTKMAVVQDNGGRGKSGSVKGKKPAEIKQQKKSQRHLRAFFEEKELQLNKKQVSSPRNTGLSERERVK